jgi:hypothetical protein
MHYTMVVLAHDDPAPVEELIDVNANKCSVLAVRTNDDIFSLPAPGQLEEADDLDEEDV